MVRASHIPRLFGADAIAFYPWTLVVLERYSDQALLAHELVHLQEQESLGRWRWWWRYLTSCRFRLAAEVRGYRAQVAMRGISVDEAARRISRCYLLRVTTEQAKRLVEG